MIARGFALALLIAGPVPAVAQTPLALEAKIPLGQVGGRIDHLAVDLNRQRLLVAELGNNSVGVVDLAGVKLLRTLFGFSEPQGLGYEPGTDTVFVANGGDGSVSVLRGKDYAALGRIELGDDADNVRIDAARNRVLVGYGKGSLALIDPAVLAKIADIRLDGHPEGFQLDAGRVYVNIPDSRSIAVLDLSAGAVVGALPTEGHRANFPMAIDTAARRVLSVFRSPPRLLVLSAEDGATLADKEVCGDADDLFVDAKRRRVYVSCGIGAVDVLEERAGSYRRLARVSTAPGARTSLFVPELDRLFVAVRAGGGEPAAIWVFRPSG